MGLPTTREHTYGAAEPVRSSDLNAIQDAIIALNDGDSVDIVTADEFHWRTAITQMIPVQIAFDPNATHTKQESSFLLGSSVNPIIYPIVIDAGVTIVSWTIRLNKASGNTRTIAGRMYKKHEDGTETALGVGDTNSLNAPGTTLLTEALAIVTDDSHQYYLKLVPAAAGAGDLARHAAVARTRP